MFFWSFGLLIDAESVAFRCQTFFPGAILLLTKSTGVQVFEKTRQPHENFVYCKTPGVGRVMTKTHLEMVLKRPAAALFFQRFAGNQENVLEKSGSHMRIVFISRH